MPLSRKRAKVGVLLATGLVQCKPKSSAASLKTITGVDESGTEVALALLPVRNFSLAKLDGDDPGVLQAAAMVRARLFALIECVPVVSERGDTISAAQLVSALEARAAIDDLYVDEERNLLTSKDDNKLAQYGSTANKLIKVPCSIHGRRFSEATGPVAPMTIIGMRSQ